MIERIAPGGQLTLAFGITAGVTLLFGACQAPSTSEGETGAAIRSEESAATPGQEAAFRPTPLPEQRLAESRDAPPAPPWARQDEDEPDDLPPPRRQEPDDDRDDDDWDEDDRYGGSAGFGIGATFDPDAFLGVGHADFYIVDHFAIGPLLQLARDSDDKIIAPSFNVKGAFELETDGPRIRPFGTAGIGFAYIEDDNRRFPRDDDDLGLLLNLGVGVDVFVVENVSVGTAVYFNFLPDEVLDERYFTSWEILAVNFHF